MTTLAWDGTILAADGGATIGNTTIKPVRKLFAVQAKSGEKYIIALGGKHSTLRPTISYISQTEITDGWPRFDPDFMQAMRDQFPAGEHLCNFYMVNEEGVCLSYENWLSLRIVEGYDAIGNGMDFALGALYMGAPAREAVAAACEYDTYTNRPITSMTAEDLRDITSEDIRLKLEAHI